MTTVVQTPGTDLVALAKSKLATHALRTTELDRLTALLHEGERVVTLCDALYRSGHQAWHGLTALTDERLICLNPCGADDPPTEVRLSAIRSVETGIPGGSGDAKRGELTMLDAGGQTRLARVRPWECADEIAEHIRVAIAARD